MDSQYNSKGIASAYGSVGATGHFDPISIIKKPQVILRLLGLLFSIVVFGCIINQGYEQGDCLYNHDPGACEYGKAVGFMAFFVLLAFLGLDTVFDNISNARYRRIIVLADMVLSGLISFLWFVCFCYLTHAWNMSEKRYNKSAMEAVLAFSFFSTGTFIAITVLAVLRYRQGVGAEMAESSGQDQHSGGASPF